MFYDWIQNMEFAYPYVFGGFLPILLFVYDYIRRVRRRQGAIAVSTAEAFTVGSWKNTFRHLPFILRLLTLIALLFALARPQVRNDLQRTVGEGIDIILAMDVSGSMSSNDILPSRIEVAKDVAIAFIENRPVDRIGVVLFSGDAFTQTPLTTDKNTLIQQIITLEGRRHLQAGTVIGEGLATAVNRLAKSDAKSKVIILITDGKEDAPSTRLVGPEAALQMAIAANIKVYTIGMGTATKTDNLELQQTAAVTFVDEDLLRRIANSTGGKYFRAKDKEALEQTYTEIDKMEKSKVEIQAFKRYDDKYFYFLLAVIFFLLIEMVLRFTVFRKFP